MNAEMTNAKIGRLMKKLGTMALRTCKRRRCTGSVEVGGNRSYHGARLHFDYAFNDYTLAGFETGGDHGVIARSLPELHGAGLHFVLLANYPHHCAHWAAQHGPRGYRSGVWQGDSHDPGAHELA